MPPLDTAKTSEIPNLNNNKRNTIDTAKTSENNDEHLVATFHTQPDHDRQIEFP